MPLRVVVNLSPEIMARFSDDGLQAFLASLASEAAEKARASLGQGPERSSPGDAPNTQTGTLLGSITSDGPVVSAGASYAGFLEDGTRKMTARPFLMKAALATQPDVEAKARAWLGL